MIENMFVRHMNKYSSTSDKTQTKTNWLLEIKDNELRSDFHASNIANRSFRVLLGYACFFTIFLIPSESILLTSISSSHDNKVQYLICSIFLYLSCLIFVCSNWLLVYSKLNPMKTSKHVSKINSLFIVSMTIYVILRMIRFSYFSCILHENNSLYFLGSICDSKVPSWDLAIYLIVCPLSSITIVKESRFYLIGCSFITLFIAFGILTFLQNKYSLLPFLFWAIYGFSIIYDLQLQNIQNYFLKRKLLETIVESENISENHHANEMRHMIANVAHDLKTPLSSFTSGLDIIEHVLSECEVSFKQTTLTVETCYDKVISIGQYLEDIRNTNSFMLMTINRCIDYTKASKGMKLVPRYETIDLMETLRLPLNCMRNIQHRIEICLKQIPEEVCSHIITDKQWLQENILCLLSNAVKYSSQGEVVIRMSLKDSMSPFDSMPLNKPMSLKLVTPKKVHNHRSIKVLPTIQSSNNLLRDFESTSESQKAQEKEKRLSLVSFLNSFSDDGNSHGPTLDTSVVKSPRSPEEAIPEDSEFEVTEKLDCIYLIFEIEDTGIGMSNEAMASLFNPFKQTQRLAGGTGLGLYSLAKRVEALNGKYGVRRRKDGKQGSLFWFSIPYKADEITASMVKKVPSSNSFRNSGLLSKQISPTQPNSFTLRKYSPIVDTSKTSKYTSLNILIADDSPSILKMTSLILRKQGHVVQTAENGAVAVKMVKDRWKETGKVFDLLLMDLQMPVMDGLEATRRIREQEKEKDRMKSEENSFSSVTSTEKLDASHSFSYYTSRPRQVIIGCSANSDSETTEEALKAGIDGFISKPFSLESFNSLASQYLPKYELLTIESIEHH